MANTNASVKKKNTRNTVLRVLLYVVIIAICLITLYPYFVTVCTALKSRAEIFSMNGTIFPVEAIWSNFTDVWKLAPMSNYMMNSIVIAGGSTLLAMVCGIPAAYALSRMKFKRPDCFSGICYCLPDVRTGCTSHRYLQGYDGVPSYQQHYRPDLYQRSI